MVLLRQALRFEEKGMRCHEHVSVSTAAESERCSSFRLQIVISCSSCDPSDWSRLWPSPYICNHLPSTELCVLKIFYYLVLTGPLGGRYCWLYICYKWKLRFRGDEELAKRHTCSNSTAKQREYSEDADSRWILSPESVLNHIFNIMHL